MKTLLTLISLFIGTYVIPINAFSQDNVLEWSVNTSNNIETNTPYKLRNSKAQSYLDYYSRNRGINLAFNRNLNIANVTFKKPGNPTEVIKYGDRIAIHVARGGYLYYKRRNWGINLTYSNTPVYQWVIRDNAYSTQNHGSVHGNAVVGLYNTHNSGFMIYGYRHWGPNLTWADTSIPSTLAQIYLSLKTGPYSFGSTSQKCTGPISWKFTPIQLTGSTGKDYEFVVSRAYEALEQNTGPNEWWCTFTDSVYGLKAGTWKIKVQTPLWTTECQTTITSGTNRVNFTEYKSGCGSGLVFPTL